MFALVGYRYFARRALGYSDLRFDCYPPTGEMVIGRRIVSQALLTGTDLTETTVGECKGRFGSK